MTESTNGVGEQSGEEDGLDEPAPAAVPTGGTNESVTEECYLLDVPVGAKSQCRWMPGCKTLGGPQHLQTEH